MNPPVVVQLRERTLANVLLDIAAATAAWKRLSGADDEADALDRLSALCDEARAMIECLTGCSWNQISEACL